MGQHSWHRMFGDFVWKVELVIEVLLQELLLLLELLSPWARSLIQLKEAIDKLSSDFFFLVEIK